MTEVAVTVTTVKARNDDASIAPELFRQVLGHVPTGVAVVAAQTDAGPAGLVVGTFMSVSLDPPLVGFLVAETSTTWPRLEPAGRFAVSVLGEDQIEISRAFSVSGGDKFAGVDWHRSELGQPILDDSLAWFDCTLEGVEGAGDHKFVLGRVSDMWVRSQGRPLIFCHGTYQRLGSS
ncbi:MULTISPECIES: flavin reductase family protein [unclassified Nocardioides]|uniref:flavin reductase family protein n=1 Tax=unclassified Nocardioides TaxID=2615069 RepID=UPI003616D649